jgi:hypothetical protein
MATTVFILIDYTIVNRSIYTIEWEKGIPWGNRVILSSIAIDKRKFTREHVEQGADRGTLAEYSCFTYQYHTRYIYQISFDPRLSAKRHRQLRLP